MIELYNGDCLEVMDQLISKGIKVDMILTDPLMAQQIVNGTQLFLLMKCGKD